MLISWIEGERILISHKWEIHRRFLDLVEPHLETTLRDWEQAIGQQAQRIVDEAERAEFYEFHSDEYHERIEFRVILMNSFFSASFALFENQLLRICRSAQRHSGSPFSVRDLGSSSPTDRAKMYLQRLGVAFPADTEEWHEATRYREIRNKLMHEGGELPSKGDITDFAHAKQIASTWSGNPILELTRQFCVDAVTLLERLLLEIHRAYERWLKTSATSCTTT